MANYYGDLKALELLKNNSVCIKTKEGIRNIQNEDELEKELTVFVSNFSLIDESLVYIKIGEMVRYKPIKIFI